METHVFIIVLLAALLHATWNAFIKADSNRLLFMATMMASGGLAALGSTLVLPLPAIESWPYILLSIVLHQGYVLCLLLAYRFGDLSHVYPLARGSAPLIVAMFAVTLANETLSHLETIAVLLMAVGIMSLSLTRGTQKLRDPRAVVFALGAGLFIAAYTLTDGIGVRLSGNAHGYSAWMIGLEWIPITVYMLATGRITGLQQIRRIWKPALAIGLMSVAAYWAVIWAMSVAPIALVAALRETSIIFAVLFGVLFLKERLSLMRLAATASTLLGAVLLKVGRP